MEACSVTVADCLEAQKSAVGITIGLAAVATGFVPVVVSQQDRKTAAEMGGFVAILLQQKQRFKIFCTLLYNN